MMRLYYDDKTIEKLKNNFREWQLLSFSIFNDEIDEINKYHNLVRETFNEDYNRSISEYDIERYILNYNHEQCHEIETQVDHMMMWKARSKYYTYDENGLILYTPFLYRHIGNRVDFTYLWNTRNYSNIKYIINDIFHNKYVNQNVMRMLSEDCIIDLASDRYDLRYKIFIDMFKQKNNFLYSFINEDIIDIILMYLQPPTFNYIK